VERGRSYTLRVNYRTSHQIRTQADLLLAPELTDVDGNKDDRSHTISIFNGPPPIIQTFPTEAGENEAVGRWISERAKAGVAPHEIAVFVRRIDTHGLNHPSERFWQVLDQRPENQLRKSN
jgi:superfamily I DNA/RNA helicase